MSVPIVVIMLIWRRGYAVVPVCVEKYRVLG